MEEDYFECPFLQCKIRNVGCETFLKDRDCDIIMKLKEALKKVMREKKIIIYSDKEYISLKKRMMEDKIVPLSEDQFKKLEDKIVQEYLEELRGREKE